MKEKIITSVFLFSLAGFLFSQAGSISPVLLAVTGNFSSSGNLVISSSVGETVVPTFYGVSKILTQGFQQPCPVTTAGVTVTGFAPSCNDATDGKVEVLISSNVNNPMYFLVDSITGDTLASCTFGCTNPYVFINVPPGSYYIIVVNVSVSGAYAVTVPTNPAPCDFIQIYNGITPNADGHNDAWIIDGIQFIDNNEVSIFNRWGSLVWYGKNYNNRDVVWEGQNTSGSRLPDGTYFYIIHIKEKNYKGWVELTR